MYIYSAANKLRFKVYSLVILVNNFSLLTTDDVGITCDVKYCKYCMRGFVVYLSSSIGNLSHYSIEDTDKRWSNFFLGRSWDNFILQ
jgi:hypothetical protein